ncbi:hypothetical protein CPB84DRAFT_802664 [Gymnopilus junonius]|uniref:Uncharacterized protein n=1 Tax=Gymnopilus junonius TaxID=109634 RepID=A0A9P5TPP9_GYMJU|nr:hypothetical protein CPB84DRAFT_802664 [Gymnopilus junonius]
MARFRFFNNHMSCLYPALDSPHLFLPVQSHSLQPSRPLLAVPTTSTALLLLLSDSSRNTLLVISLSRMFVAPHTCLFYVHYPHCVAGPHLPSLISPPQFAKLFASELVLYLYPRTIISFNNPPKSHNHPRPLSVPPSIRRRSTFPLLSDLASVSPHALSKAAITCSLTLNPRVLVRLIYV